MHTYRPVRLALGLAAILCCLGVWSADGAALGPATKVVRFHGYRLIVPAGWPVYRIESDPATCVRFDRHAVYLGRPSPDQRCPAHAAGRTEAIAVEPERSPAIAAGGSDRETQLRDASSHVVVTATWNQNPAVIEHALGVRTLGRSAPPATPRAPHAGAAAAGTGQARPGVWGRVASAATQPGAVYTGLGFDACAAPSPSQMSAWGASPYRAIGVYIGGANMACSQGNLTGSWVTQESAAGWGLIPTYVGLQAPTNSCGCAAISPSNATSEGAAAASDAVARAQAIGLGPGNPLYFDMESYPTGGSNTSAVLAFLAAWTGQLHTSGYKSGVYSSADSGIVDLVSQLGTGYQEPDDIWIARWNGAQNTADPNVPSTAWASHQRLHQYSGAHNETYGGATINIDGDYVDAATAAAGSGTPVAASAPTLSVSTAADGGIDLYPSWTGATGISSWLLIAGPTATALAPAANPISTGTKPPIVVHSAFAYFAVQALGPAGNVLGSSAAVATPAHVAIFGQSAFVSRRGTGGLPVGCFNSSPCHVSTTISVGRTVVASAGSEHIPTGGGVAYVDLTQSGRAMLARAHGHRLGVKVSVHDVSGLRATSRLALIPFTSSGRGPVRSSSPSPLLQVVGGTDFVSRGWVGGILAGCFASAPCHTTMVIAAGGRTIARTGSQFLGVNQLGYLFFSLTPAGHAMLARARGNQLPASVTITSGGAIAGAQIALVSFR